MNVRSSVVVFFRVIQITLVLLSVLAVLGSLSMPAIQAVFVWVFALVLLAFAGVTEGMVRLTARGGAA